jgi:hypothetical protein
MRLFVHICTNYRHYAIHALILIITPKKPLTETLPGRHRASPPFALPLRSNYPEEIICRPGLGLCPNRTISGWKQAGLSMLRLGEERLRFSVGTNGLAGDNTLHRYDDNILDRFRSLVRHGLGLLRLAAPPLGLPLRSGSTGALRCREGR